MKQMRHTWKDKMRNLEAKIANRTVLPRESTQQLFRGKIASTTVQFFPKQRYARYFPRRERKCCFSSPLEEGPGRDERGASQLNQITKKTERTLERFPDSLQQPEPPHLEQPLFNDPPLLPALCLEILLPPFPSFFSLKFVDF